MIFLIYSCPKIKPSMYDIAYHLISKEKIESPEVNPNEHAVSVSLIN